ncbi:MAG TPA: protein kinase [Herpetosiphonaceae bacterium]
MSDLDLIGRTIHHFKIESQLGRGGMAVVYKAHQTDLERDIALKILPPEMTYDKSYIARFQQEAKAAARLEHSHIVPIYEIGSADGFYYIAMKFIEGETLKDVIDRQGPMPLSKVLELLEPIGKALDYAHKKGVVHRDIKPSNVMVTPEGWVFLADFGLARGNTGDAGLTQAGTIMGTPEYMSPEQAQGAQVGPPSDLFALAIMVYEMLSGGMPFSGDNPQSILFARVMKPPTPPSVHRPNIPSKLEDVLMKALARQPEARYESAAELFKALREAAGMSSGRRDSPAAGTPLVGDEPTVYKRREPGSQPSYPPSGSSPGYMPGAQPSYPPPGSQPSYPPMGSQPNYVAGPGGFQQAGYSGGPAQPISYGPPAQSFPPPPQPISYGPPSAPSLGPTIRARPKPKTGLWIGIGIAALVVLGILFAATRTPSVTGQLTKGQQALDGGRLSEAVAAFEEATQRNDKSFEAYERLALTQWMRGRYPEAEDAAQKAINLKGTAAAPHVWFSLAYSEDRKPREALAQAEEALRQEPSVSLGNAARAVTRADIAYNQKDPDLMEQAIADAEEAISSSKDENTFAQAMALYAKGHVLHHKFELDTKLGYDPDQADLQAGIDAMNEAIALQDFVPEFHSFLGSLHAEKGEYDEAKTAFDDAISRELDFANAYSGKGWAEIDQKNYADALLLFDEALKRASQDPNALIGRGYAHWYLGDAAGEADKEKEYKDAAADFEAAVAESPDLISVYEDLGYLYLRSLKDFPKAEGAFSRALEKDPTYGQAQIGMGNVLFEQGKTEESIPAYQHALEIDPTLVYAYLNLSGAYKALDRMDEAKSILNEGMGKVRPADQHLITERLSELGV